jgi:hypothetical protein
MMTVEEFAEALIQLLVTKQKSSGGDIILQASTLEALLRDAVRPKLVQDLRYPAWRYHAKEPARIVESETEDQKLGSAWTAQPQGRVE